MSESRNREEKSKSPKVPKKEISVKMRQNLTIEQIRPWCKVTAARVIDEMPYGVADLHLNIDFTGFALTKGLKKMMMDELMEEIAAIA